MKTITPIKAIRNCSTYNQYKKLIADFATSSKTTGERTEERVHATRLNAQRIKRIDKQFVISEEIKKELKQLHTNWLWIILIETWCGDGAQIFPS
jgi:hypothetical protein